MQLQKKVKIKMRAGISVSGPDGNGGNHEKTDLSRSCGDHAGVP